MGTTPTQRILLLLNAGHDASALIVSSLLLTLALLLSPVCRLLTNVDAGRGSNTSYKANVNRTKTRKWVEAKVQSYDGDDWGNDYDDEYDDGNDEHYEPEPMPPKPTKLTGFRQPGQTGHQLPSSRIFSQPSTSSWSDADSRSALGPPSLRNPSGPPSLHVQTQATAVGATTPPYTIESAHPATTSSHTNVQSSSYSAGPASTPSRFPPRKSSMGQQDRPNLEGKQSSKSDSRPGSSSGNRPWVDQRSASPANPAKTVPFVRPADIYKRVGDEKEKERLSMESGRPSLDSIPGRGDGQRRSSVEQGRRTSLESQDGSDSARPRKSNLAPVAERKSEYGMDGLLAKAQADQLPASSQEPPTLSPGLSVSQTEPNDEVKADLMKSRRFSTSPQLPSLSRMSGFGDDFFSSSGKSSSWASPNLLASPDRQSPFSNENKTTAAPIGGTLQEQPRSVGGSPGANPATTTSENLGTITESTTETDKSQLAGTRPQLPGGWVTETSTVPTSFYGATPTEYQQEPHGPISSGGVENTHTTPMAQSDAQPDDISQVTEAPTQPVSFSRPENTSANTTLSGLGVKDQNGDAEHHNKGIPPTAAAPIQSDEFEVETQFNSTI
ncbi:hypothetical protein NPX13_g9305 [Xylaria arbuscula]|uniref:Uncharacterized protein n=1 Tax=Xylaria arbuscula TaxID=114810 RepID=A0A9W8TIL0_9PEZI|nr:hypothetical protein NPX13_g9305 [Xylaria arbuscula]